MKVKKVIKIIVIWVLFIVGYYIDYFGSDRLNFFSYWKIRLNMIVVG